MTAPKHIVAATDFSPASDGAVAFAAELAERLGAKLTIVHCHEARHPYPVPVPPEVVEELHLRLEQRYGPLRAGVAIVRQGAASTEILSLAEEVAADLIVVGAGKLTEKIVRAAHVAVAIVPARAA